MGFEKEVEIIPGVYLNKYIKNDSDHSKTKSNQENVNDVIIDMSAKNKISDMNNLDLNQDQLIKSKSPFQESYLNKNINDRDIKLLTVSELKSIEKSIDLLEQSLLLNPNDQFIIDCIYENMRILDYNLSYHHKNNDNNENNNKL